MGKKIQCIGRYVMDCQTLGKGNFARVELATHSVTGCKVAIKIIDTRKIKEEYVRNNLHREARILGQLRHPNIIRLYETLKATTLYCLVLECAGGGDLQSYIKTFKELFLPEDKARVFMRQLISAVHYLHERGVAHRDLKMENIMLDEKKKNVKIVDFGLSNTFKKDDLMKTHCGSLEYAAPELFDTQNRYGPEVDIWSIGIILYAMVVGRLPFTTPYTDQFRRQKLLQQIEKGLSEQQEKEMTHLSEDCKHLLKKLIEPVSSLRLPLMDIEIHPWVTRDAKTPFYPFHAFPRDKSMKSQVVDELTELLSMNKEQVEKTVQENKCDDLSAMFNMLMDSKRIEKGVHDVDYTAYQERKERRERRRENKGTKHRKKLPPKLDKDSKTLPDKESVTEKATTSTSPQAGKDAEPAVMSEAEKLQAEHDHRVSTNFDFMALCSAPTWLGVKRSRSKRRRNPPVQSPLSQNPDSAQQSTDTLVVSQGTLDNPNLLSPNQQYPTAYRRRSFHRSSRRKPRSNSYGPVNRRTNSVKDYSTSSSQPNSPTNVVNPEIRIDPPKPPQILRPDRLGIKECYKTPEVTLHVPNHKPRALGIDTSESLYDESDHHIFSDNSDAHSDDGSHIDMLDSINSHKNGWTDSLLDTSTAEIHSVECSHVNGDQSKSTFSHQDSVEARIASVDIKTIVRPKKKQQKKNQNKNKLLQMKIDHSISNDSECTTNSSSGSSENFSPIAMQHSNDENVSEDEEKCQACGGVEAQVKLIEDNSNDIGCHDSDIQLSDIECVEDHVDSKTHLLGASANASLFKTVHPLKNLRVSDEPEDLVFVEEEIEGERTWTDTSCPAKLDLSLPIPKNGPQLITKQTIQVLGCEKPVVSKIKENLPEDKISPLTPVDSYSKNLYKFTMPSTPTRNMFKTPLARIESFHSDDFDSLVSNVDVTLKSNATTPSSTSQTPTLPCFAYKLHLNNKKNVKLKSSKAKGDTASKIQECTKYAKDDKKGISLETEQRVDPANTDPLLSSSGSETKGEKSDDGSDKAPSVSKAKIHPMDKEDQENEMMVRGSKICKSNQKNKCTANTDSTTGNDVKSKKTQNSTEKPSKLNNTESKKSSMKCSPWKHGFVQLLRRKRHGHRSHNNNDSLRSNHHPTSATRNGHTHTSYGKPTVRHSQEESSGEMEAHFNNSPLPNYPDTLEIHSSPNPGHTPSSSTAKVFDFTVVTSGSPQATSCLLNWKGCRECTFGDDQISDEGDSDCTYRFDQSMEVAVKARALNTTQDNKDYAAYKYGHT